MNTMENLNNNLELRYATELRYDTNNGLVYGTAIVFNSESNPIRTKSEPFIEIIKPSAATQDFLETQEIFMRYNHQPDIVLARYSPTAQRNSLSFNVDSRGVHFSFKPKKAHQDIIESVAAGDLRCSFAFRAADNGDTIERRSNGTLLRTVTKMDIVQDFSFVINPAYNETSCTVRSIDEFRQAEELNAQAIVIETKKSAEEIELEEKRFNEYYKKLKKEYLPKL
jgi:hypothetical protein